MKLANLRPYALSALRLVAGFLFLAHGLQKLFGALGGTAHQPGSFMFYAGLIEGVGGLLIMIGLFTRVAAFVSSGQMAAAYFMGHAAKDWWPILNRGELAALYCFVFLYLAIAGPGPLSLDRLLRRKT
jgi:putative oxidoreductase